MKKSKIIFMLSMLLVLFVACDNTEYIETNPQLEITVINKYVVPVEGAAVSLYTSENDWEAKHNPVRTMETDFAGTVLFEDLEELKYYFYVEKDSLDNLGDIAATKDSLQIGRKSEVLVKIFVTDFERY